MNVYFPGAWFAVLTLHVPVPFLSSVITQTTLPPDLTVTVPVGGPDTLAGAFPDDEQPATPATAPRMRATQRTRERTRTDHHHCQQNGRGVSRRGRPAGRSARQVSKASQQGKSARQVSRYPHARRVSLAPFAREQSATRKQHPGDAYPPATAIPRAPPVIRRRISPPNIAAAPYRRRPAPSPNTLPAKRPTTPKSTIDARQRHDHEGLIAQ